MANGHASASSSARPSSNGVRRGGARCHPRGRESRGCHCTLAALSESAVQTARALARACTLVIELRPARRRSMPRRVKSGGTARSPLWARVQCDGQGSSLALVRSASISAQSGGDRCHPPRAAAIDATRAVVNQAGCHCTLAALSESAVRGGRGRRSRLHARHRSPPKAAAIDATRAVVNREGATARSRLCARVQCRRQGCAVVNQEGATARSRLWARVQCEGAGVVARACTLAIDLRPERRRSMPPAQL